MLLQVALFNAFIAQANCMHSMHVDETNKFIKKKLNWSKKWDDSFVQIEVFVQAFLEWWH